MNGIDQKLFSLIPTLEKEASEYLSKYLTSLISCQPDCDDLVLAARIYGSGVFFQIGDNHFLITAAHNYNEVFEPLARKYGTPTWLSSGIKDSPVVRINYFPEGVFTKDDRLDMCALKLKTETAEELKSNGARFLRMSQTNPENLPECPAWYLLIGFPSNNQKVSRIASSEGKQLGLIEEKAFCYLTQTFSNTQMVDNFLPNAHVVLACGREGSFYSPELPMNFPAELGGISGCGVWRLTEGLDSLLNYDRNTLSLESAVRLVGLQFSYNNKAGYLKAAKLSILLHSMMKRWPELEKQIGMSVFFPPSPKIRIIGSID